MKGKIIFSDLNLSFKTLFVLDNLESIHKLKQIHFRPVQSAITGYR